MKKALSLIMGLLMAASLVFTSCDQGDDDDEVAVTGVTLNKTEISLVEGESYELKETVSPKDADNKKVEWTSDNTEVAIVTGGGKVTAVSAGTAKITVTTKDGKKTAVCTVTVTPSVVHVQGIALDKESLVLKVGNSETLVSLLTPAAPTNPTVFWVSSDSEVAAVAQDGKVTAIAVGTAVITATTEDGDFKVECNVTVEINNTPVQSVTPEGELTREVVKGDSITLSAIVVPAEAPQALSWTAEPETVATVENGVVTAVSDGEATITATSAADSTKKASWTVKVLPIKVTGVQLKESTTILINGTEVLVPTVSPANADNQAVSWTSSKPEVAAVAADGTVTAKSVGTATITVKTADGEFTAACTVTVADTVVPVTGVSLNKTTISLVKGNTEKLTATVLPANATSGAVSWTSSKPEVAAVAADGTVTAVEKGTATITVTSVADNTKKATCTVTVTGVPVASVTATGDGIRNLVKGGTDALAATVLPSNAENKALEWKSNAESVVSVDQNGKITAKGKGTATVTATSKADSTKKVSWTVNVSVPVANVTLDKSTLSFTAVGQTEKLTATVAPSDADSSEVVWSSSDQNKAVVAADGTVTAKAEGTAKITATSKVDGTKKAECTVTVTLPVAVTGVSIGDTKTVKYGDNAKFEPVFTPSNATNKSVTYTSSNEDVATVAADGTITINFVGKTTITVTTEDGSKTDTCELIVEPKEVVAVSLDAIRFKPGYKWSTSGVEDETTFDGYMVKDNEKLDKSKITKGNRIVVTCNASEINTNLSSIANPEGKENPQINLQIVDISPSVDYWNPLASDTVDVVLTDGSYKFQWVLDITDELAAEATGAQLFIKLEGNQIYDADGKYYVGAELPAVTNNIDLSGAVIGGNYNGYIGETPLTDNDTTYSVEIEITTALPEWGTQFYIMKGADKYCETVDGEQVNLSLAGSVNVYKGGTDSQKSITIGSGLKKGDRFRVTITPSELYIQISVEKTYDAPGGDGGPVWEGENTLSNWESGKIDLSADKITSDTTGLKITWSASAESGINLQMQAMNWSDGPTKMKFKKSGDDGYSEEAYLWPDSTTTEFTFDEESLSLLKQYGVQLFGNLLTITKIELIK